MIEQIASSHEMNPLRTNGIVKLHGVIPYPVLTAFRNTPQKGDTFKVFHIEYGSAKGEADVAWVGPVGISSSGFDPDHAEEFPYNGNVVPVPVNNLRPVPN